MSWLLRSALFLALAAVALSQKRVFDYSYPEFKTEELSVPITISASWNRTADTTDEPDGRWINPKIVLMDFNTQVYPGYTLSADKLNLTIATVTREDLGYWHAMMVRSDVNGTVIKTDALQKVGLNVKGPFFEDLWRKYERNTTIGLGAGFGFAVFAVVLCMAWQFRWEKRAAKRRIADAGLEDDLPAADKMKVEAAAGKLPEKQRAEPEPEVVAMSTVTPVEVLSKGQTNAAFEADEQPEVRTASMTTEATPVKKPSPPPSYTEEVASDAKVAEIKVEDIAATSAAPAETTPATTSATPATTSPTPATTTTAPVAAETTPAAPSATPPTTTTAPVAAETTPESASATPPTTTTAPVAADTIPATTIAPVANTDNNVNNTNQTSRV